MYWLAGGKCVGDNFWGYSVKKSVAKTFKFL